MSCLFNKTLIILWFWIYAWYLFPKYKPKSNDGVLFLLLNQDPDGDMEHKEKLEMVGVGPSKVAVE